jgi:hypothetical protein
MAILIDNTTRVIRLDSLACNFGGTFRCNVILCDTLSDAVRTIVNKVKS